MKFGLSRLCAGTTFSLKTDFYYVLAETPVVGLTCIYNVDAFRSLTAN